MRNHKEKPRERPDVSSQVPGEVKKDDAPTPLSGHDNQDSSGASQQDAPITEAEALDRQLERANREQDLPPESPMEEIENIPGTEPSAVPSGTESRSSVDVPKPETGITVPDERETPLPLVPDEIRQSDQDARQEFEKPSVEVKQKSDSFITKLEEQNEALRSRIMELEEQHKALHRRVEDLEGKGALLPIETSTAATGQGPAVVDVASLVDYAWSQEKSGIELDQKELDDHFKDMKQWCERVSMLREGLRVTADEFGDIVTKSNQITRTILEQLPQETQGTLVGRQEGLDLIARMLYRQVDRAETVLAVDAEPDMKLPTVSELGWRALVDKTDWSAPDQMVQKKQSDIRRKLKDASQKRFQVIAGVRDAKEKYRKAFLKFTERQLLPVLDSIDDGEEHSQQEIKALMDDYSGIAEQLDTWFQTYGDLRDKLLKVLKRVGIRPMVVNIGEKIQYSHHEPFGVDPDPKFEDETIIAVTRKGYEYESYKGAEVLDLRPAQVIVVKNEKNEGVASDAS